MKRSPMSRTQTEDDPLLNDVETARMLGVSVATTRRWRQEDRGPEYVKVGGFSVRYRLSAIREFLDACETGGGSVMPRICA